MVKNKDGASDNPYHGVLDEWAREQQQAAAAHAREGDKTAEEGDNEGRGTMTEEWLEQIRKRAEAATPGPWVWWDVEIREQGTVIMGRLGPMQGKEGSLNGFIGGKASAGIQASQEDAEFVACARDDVPALLAFAEAALPILRAVANVPQDAYGGRGDAGPWITTCPLCHYQVGAEYVHWFDCPVAKARALLAGTEGEGG